MKKKKEYKVGDIDRWQGIRNCDTGLIESGYLWIVTDIDENGNKTCIGKSIRASNRSEAIKKYKEICST